MLGLVYELFSKINLFPIFKDIEKPRKKFDELGLDDQIKFFADNGFDFEAHEAQKQDMDCLKSLNQLRNRIVHDGNIAKRKVKIHWYGAPDLRFIYGMRGEEKLFWDKKSVIYQSYLKLDQSLLWYMGFPAMRGATRVAKKIQNIPKSKGLWYRHLGVKGKIRQ
jgi:hypothetical protein